MTRLSTRVPVTLLVIGAIALTTGLLVTAVAATPQAATSVEDRHTQLEPNDEFDTATNITIPYERDGLETSFDDTDIYAVTLQPGVRVTTTVAFSHADGDIDLYILDPNRDLIRQSTSITDDESTAFQAGIDGTYYIVVDGWADTPTPYAITVTGTQDELPTNDQFEYNDGFSTATDIDPSFDRAELRIAGGEYDYYAVTVPDNTQLNVTARHNASIADLDLRIYNETQGLLATGLSAFDNETATAQIRAGGTYYIEVSSHNDNSAWYHLTLNTEPISPTEPTTTPPTQPSTTTDDQPPQTTTTPAATTTGDDGPGFTIPLTIIAILLIATRHHTN